VVSAEPGVWHRRSGDFEEYLVQRAGNAGCESGAYQTAVNNEGGIVPLLVTLRSRVIHTKPVQCSCTFLHACCAARRACSPHTPL